MYIEAGLWIKMAVGVRKGKENSDVDRDGGRWLMAQMMKAVGLCSDKEGMGVDRADVMETVGMGKDKDGDGCR